MSDQPESSGPRPVFRLAPSEPDLGQLILTARDEVVEDNSLSLGSRLMFVRILDLSVRQSSNVRPGVVTISQMKLSEKFSVSERTIWNWRAELIGKRYVWMSLQPMPNAWPIDTYHVSAIHPPANSGDKTTSEGLWGNGTRRARPSNGLGARPPVSGENPTPGPRRNQLRVANSFIPPAKSSNLLENATAGRNPLRRGAETDCDWEPKQVATGSRNRLRLGAETGCDGEPKQIATGSRNQLRLGAETDCEHKKALGVGNSSLEVGGNPPLPPDLDLAAAIKDGDGAFGDWRDSWSLKSPGNPGGEFRGKIVKELGRCRLKLQIQPGPFWKRRAEHLQSVLDGGKAPASAPANAKATGAASPPKKPMPPEKRAKLFAKAKKDAGL